MGIGKKIKEARNAQGMTQEELAQRLGVTKGAVANYENETSHPKESVMYKMFEALDVDANYLFQDVVKNRFSNYVASDEVKILQKYRSLDGHGKRVVLFLLEEEYRRCSASRFGDEPDIDAALEKINKNNKDSIAE